MFNECIKKLIIILKKKPSHNAQDTLHTYLLEHMIYVISHWKYNTNILFFRLQSQICEWKRVRERDTEWGLREISLN